MATKKKTKTEPKKKHVDNPNVIGLHSEVMEQPITQTLEQNYMHYSMSTNVSRAFPDIDGFTVFREVQRKNPNSYVIFISARNQDIDRLAGLELGGDDYISKPFLVRELVIKVQRLLKGGRPKTAEVQVGPYTVHLEKHLVYCGSESISLTVKEYDLLLYLAANRGHVLKRGDILDAVWGYTFYGSDRVVDDTIRRLRKKLPGIEISTLYGLGYCLTGERHESLCD